MTKKVRIPIVDVLTLIATLLVVMGHHKFLRDSISWYPIYDKIIYAFHMGFFMTISGFLIKYTFPSDCLWSKYVGKKARKFIPAYLAVGVIAALISFESLKCFGNDLLMLIINPVKGPIQIIWYIYVLLVYYCLAPVVFRLSTKQRWWLLLLSLIPAACCLKISTCFCLQQIFRLMPFFLFGVQIADKLEVIRAVKDWKILLMGMPFVVFVVACIVLNYNPVPNTHGYGKLLTSFLSLPLMYLIGRWLCGFRESVAILSKRFSKYVYSVYLCQMFFIEGFWLLWRKTPLTLNDETAVLYLVCSVSFTFGGIILMAKTYRWGLSKLLNKEKTQNESR